MKRAPRLLAFAILASAPGAHAQKISAAGFSYEQIHSGNGMTALDFDSSGRMFVCEKQGRVLVFNPDGKGGFKAPGVFADFRKEVNPDGESGLLGIAVDPQFTTNHFLYVFYTGNTDQRLVRLTADTGFAQATAGSELILLKDLPRTATNHKAGDIHIHPKDPKAIYLVLGDDTKRELSADLDYFNGKLLRLSTADGKGLADNPFSNSDLDSVRSRVWACGFRNPFRFTFVPGQLPDSVYVSENGDGTDRLAKVKRGANAGWGRDGDKGLISPPDANTHVLFTSKPCLTAVAIAPKGPFAPDGPVIYSENWFKQEMVRWKLDGNQLDQISPIPADQNAAFMNTFMCVQATFGPDGALYMTQTYYSASEGNNHKLGRIVFKSPPKP
ncbi:MAG: PQQ-dependent sugar dehydrogenase [Luteolibacter sp.]|uniref:PQQ-dependent sugar dehydrogenase n=1 Tax=Luteolibacter sp. TaxID=1962973 RepID=UPI0032635CDE